MGVFKINKIKVVIKNISNESMVVSGNKIKPSSLSEMWITKDEYKLLKSNEKVEIFTYVSMEFVNSAMSDIRGILDAVNEKISKIELYIPEYKEEH